MKILGRRLGARASRAHLTKRQILRAGRPRSQARISKICAHILRKYFHGRAANKQSRERRER